MLTAGVAQELFACLRQAAAAAAADPSEPHPAAPPADACAAAAAMIDGGGVQPVLVRPKLLTLYRTP
jgi:hypothetical protein